MVNYFKKAVYLPVLATQEYDVVGIIEVGHMCVGSNLNPRAFLRKRVPGLP